MEPGAKGVDRQQTVAVDDPPFPANQFGLSHVHGNVWEWVQDCYRDSYDNAPSDGSKSVERSDCPERVLRGNSWSGNPMNLRSALRYWGAPVVRNFNVGFRVARMLTPLINYLIRSWGSGGEGPARFFGYRHNSACGGQCAADGSGA